MKQIWRMSLMITTLIILDQVTKGMVQSKFALGDSLPILDGFFNLTYVRNPGAAFGLGAQSHDIIRMILFKIIPVFACFGLLYWIWKTRNENKLLNLAYSLILAGAVGNLIDRILLGYVVDFLDFYYKTNHFPAFNVADSCITIAAGLIIVDYILEIKQNRNKNASSSI
jgi:signal peptidase II